MIEDLLERCGITLVASFSGNSTVGKFENSHTADLNCVMCHRSINYVADMMEKQVRHSLDQGEFHRRRELGQVAAADRPVFRGRGADRPHRAGDRRGNGRRQAVARPGNPRPLRRQDGHALRGRQPGPSLPGPVHRDRHEDRGRRLRVRPSRRLRGPPRAARPSRSMPTAATSKSCTSMPDPSATGRARPRGACPAGSRRDWTSPATTA